MAQRFTRRRIYCSGMRPARRPTFTPAGSGSKERMQELTPELRSFILTEAIARRLYLQGVAQAQLIVTQLAERGFCVCTDDGQLAYDPADPALHEAVTQLASIYRQQLIEITHLVHG
jgi:hypothetical protein